MKNKKINEKVICSQSLNHYKSRIIEVNAVYKQIMGLMGIIIKYHFRLIYQN